MSYSSETASKLRRVGEFLLAITFSTLGALIQAHEGSSTSSTSSTSPCHPPILSLLCSALRATPTAPPPFGPPFPSPSAFTATLHYVAALRRCMFVVSLIGQLLTTTCNYQATNLRRPCPGNGAMVKVEHHHSRSFGSVCPDWSEESKEIGTDYQIGAPKAKIPPLPEKEGRREADQSTFAGLDEGTQGGEGLDEGNQGGEGDG